MECTTLGRISSPYLPDAGIPEFMMSIPHITETIHPSINESRTYYLPQTGDKRRGSPVPSPGPLGVPQAPGVTLVEGALTGKVPEYAWMKEKKVCRKSPGIASPAAAATPRMVASPHHPGSLNSGESNFISF